MKIQPTIRRWAGCLAGLAALGQWLAGAAVPTSNLALWLKADAGVASDAGAVSSWADQSGQGRDAIQTNASYQPTLVTASTGNPGIRFDGANDFLSFNVPINGLANLSIVLVTSSASAAQNGGPACSNSPAIFWNETGSWGWTYLGPFQTNVNWRFGTSQQYAPRYARPASIGAKCSIATLIKAANVEALYVDGAWAMQLDDTLYPLAGASDSGYLGRATTSYFNGDILEVLVYTAALSEADRLAIEQYLHDKYFAAQPPTVAITSPAPGAWLVAPANITITADAADDGSIAQVDFYVDGALVGSDTTAPYSVEWNNVAAGPYSLTAKATDNSGAYSFSERVMALVNWANPADGPVLSGLGLWLKADAGITAVNGAVSEWADQSGQGHHAAQGTSSYRPAVATSALGMPVVRFDGSNDGLSFNMPINGLEGITIFLVGNNNSATQNGGTSIYDSPAICWTEFASWGYVFLSPFQTNVNWRFGTTVAQNNLHRYPRPASIGNKYTITTLMKNADVETLYIDRSMAAQISDKNFPLAGVGDAAWLGRSPRTSSAWYNGDLLEVLVYTTALSDADRQAVETYLHQKHLANQPPAVAITSPAAGASFNPPASITIAADATDDGSIAQVEFFVDGELIATDTTAPFTAAWNNVGSGAYGLTAKATDNKGAYTLSERVVARVNFPNPTDGPVLDGLGLWYKADAGITASDNLVSKWADQSGNERHAVQSAAASRPTLVTSGLGKPAVSFDGFSDHMTFGMPMDGLSGLTIVLVANNTVPQTTGSGGEGAAAMFWSESLSWGALSVGVFQNSVNWRIGTTVSQSGSPNYPGPAYTRPASIARDYTRNIVLKNGADEWLYVDGQIVATVSGKELATAGIDKDGGNLGRGVIYPTWYYYRGEILEALVYDRTLSEAEVAHIETYLQAKYWGKTPPTVAITAPANNTAATARSSIVVTADAADADGTVAQVEFFDSGTLVGTATSAPYTVTIPNAAPGSHMLTAKVTDNDGLYRYSGEVLVFANAASGFTLIDNFENRALAPILYQGSWLGAFGDTANDSVVMDPTGAAWGGNPQNKVLRLATAKQSLAFPALLKDGQTGTLFFRCASTTWSRDDVSLGLSDLPCFGYAVANYYETRILRQTGSNLGTRNFGIYDGGTLHNSVHPFASDMWYKVWVVIDNTADTWQMYVQAYDAPAPVAAAHDGVTTFSFRNGVAANDLIRFFIYTPQQTVSNLSSGGGFWLDDIYLALGQDLSDPTIVVPQPEMAIGWSGDALVISWPASAAGFKLEWCGDLANPSWAEFGTAPVQVGDQMTVTLQPEGAAKFFQLAK